jgi:TetR/AcrR family transcriptional regulator, transcriptional repressor for nem operon
MRKSKAEAAKTRERILEAASAQFLSHGITDAGLARLMRAAGLTHGGFYRHFASKDQLVAEACSQAVLSLTSGLESQIEGKPPDQALPLLVGKYVSRSHRDQPATGCVLAALGSELARADAKTREAATEGFLGLSRLIAGQLKNVPAKKAEVQSMAIAAAMIGAITVARIVPDSRISNSILVGTRDHILKSVRRKR